jgi:hypothetical protein
MTHDDVMGLGAEEKGAFVASRTMPVEDASQEGCK